MKHKPIEIVMSVEEEPGLKGIKRFDFNSKINVEKPENVQSVKDLMGGMFGSDQQQKNGSDFLPTGSDQKQGGKFNFQGNTSDGEAMEGDRKKKIKKMQMSQ
ncbi:MAG: hypothetical protein BRC22_02590 [Parcubacteria group bacterium QH_9_35_7]|nr:MAG: hypothetical protein BRC22_02590 [Parcubacteria group bacterium QH_9_35_7]